jgi:hypothetical protein
MDEENPFHSPFVFNEDDVQGWRVRLAMLCQSCPVHSQHPDHCPLHEIGKLKVSEQIEFVKALPPEILRYVLARHEVCQEKEIDRILRDALLKACDSAGANVLSGPLFLSPSLESSG